LDFRQDFHMLKTVAPSADGFALAGMGCADYDAGVGEDVWEDLPTELRLALTPTAESSASASASLFPDEGLPPHGKRIVVLLKSDESTHIDEIVEKLETELSSSEIFAALLE
jgi:hypothetical protein